MSGGSSSQAIVDAQPEMSLDEVRERMASYRERVEELRRRYPVGRGMLLQALWLVQEEFGWVPRIAMKWAAEVSEVSPVHAFGVVEFYTMYHQAPIGRHLIQVCQTMCCQLYGADDLIAHLEERLGISSGETTDDGLFTLVRVECLAACGNGPSVLIDDRFLYGPGELDEHQEGWHPTAEALDRWIDRLRAEAAEDQEPRRVDMLGGLRLGSAGHPGAPGASAAPLPEDYAAPPPAIKVKAEAEGDQVTVTFLCAPECVEASVEQSPDGKGDWTAVGLVDLAEAPSVPGPPGGPKSPTWKGTIEEGAECFFRIQVREAYRRGKPSAVAPVEHAVSAGRLEART